MNALATAPTGLSVARSAEIASALLRGSFGADASPAIGALKTAAVIGTPAADRPDGELDLNQLYDGGTRRREFRPDDVVSSTLFKQ